jgi:hypothetical protein
MEMFASNGRRPLAWWEFESPIPWPGYERQQSALFEAGLLTEVEAAGLTTWWRAQFERAQQPDFSYCLGPMRWVKGSRARREQYAWADIPPSLVRKWSTEHKRQARTIRKLEAEAAPHEEIA